MENVQIDQIIRSRRKTIGLHITSDARLIVRAPHFASENYIIQLIQRKESWIRSKQEYFKKHQEKITVKDFVPGEEFLYLGRKYPLTAVDDLPKAVVLGESLMISSMVLANAQVHIENWYKTQALDVLTERVNYWANDTGLTYKSVKINQATTRWGSCGYNDTLNFTWRLIMAPERVVDYVVIHELMHIKQKNHSRKFWLEVLKVLPNYKWDEQWLKENPLFWPSQRRNLK